MIVYKLTDQDGYTRRAQSGETRWRAGERHTLPECDNPELCQPGVYHSYRTPYEAALYNPVHANLKNPLLWECETEQIILDDGTKLGTFDLRPMRQCALPELTVEQRVKIAMRLALDVYNEPSFVAWAEAWLDGTDRSEAAAGAAARAAAWAARAAAWAAWAAAWAAGAAARAAAWAAAGAARAADDPMQAHARFAEVVQAVLEEVEDSDA